MHVPTIHMLHIFLMAMLNLSGSGPEDRVDDAIITFLQVYMADEVFFFLSRISIIEIITLFSYTETHHDGSSNHRSHRKTRRFRYQEPGLQKCSLWDSGSHSRFQVIVFSTTLQVMSQYQISGGRHEQPAWDFWECPKSDLDPYLGSFQCSGKTINGQPNTHLTQLLMGMKNRRE